MTLFIVLAIIWMVDTILLATWNPYYFRFGIPLFKTAMPVSSKTSGYLSTAGFSETWKAESIESSLKANSFSKYELALREPLSIESLSYEGFVHGYLAYKTADRCVAVRLSASLFATSLYLVVIGAIGLLMIKAFQTDVVIAGLISPFGIVAPTLIIRSVVNRVSEFKAMVRHMLDEIAEHKPYRFTKPGR